MKCRAAAQAIAQAEVLLLATGAGFSADSGLKVYNDIADVPAYRAAGLTYMDLCVPDHLTSGDLELFWGFWGSCFNDYRQTRPHAGYDIVRSWRDEFFHGGTRAARHIRNSLRGRTFKFNKLIATSDDGLVDMALAPVPQAEEQAKQATTSASDHAGPAARPAPAQTPQAASDLAAEPEPWPGARAPAQTPQSTTSDLANASELLTPAARHAGEALIKPSVETHPYPGPFFVMTSNVDAHSFQAGLAANEVHEIHGNCEKFQCATPCTSDIWYAPADLKFVVDPDTMRASGCLTAQPTAGFDREFPYCPKCNGPARPAVLMFGDTNHQADDACEERFSAWEDAALEICSQADRMPLVVLEIGCGLRVPSIRRHVEGYLLMKTKNMTLIRINPDFAFGDAPPIDESDQFIAIKGKALSTLKILDELVREARALARHELGPADAPAHALA